MFECDSTLWASDPALRVHPGEALPWAPGERDKNVHVAYNNKMQRHVEVRQQQKGCVIIHR